MADNTKVIQFNIQGQQAIVKALEMIHRQMTAISGDFTTIARVQENARQVADRYVQEIQESTERTRQYDQIIQNMQVELDDVKNSLNDVSQKLSEANIELQKNEDAAKDNTDALGEQESALDSLSGVLGDFKEEAAFVTVGMGAMAGAAHFANERWKELVASERSVTFALKRLGAQAEADADLVEDRLLKLSVATATSITDIQNQFVEVSEMFNESGHTGRTILNLTEGFYDFASATGKSVDEVKGMFQNFMNGPDGVVAFQRDMGQAHRDITNQVLANTLTTEQGMMQILRQYQGVAADTTPDVEKLYLTLNNYKDSIVKFVASLGAWPTLTAVVTAAIVGAGFALAGLIAGLKASRKQYDSLMDVLGRGIAWWQKNVASIKANIASTKANIASTKANTVSTNSNTASTNANTASTNTNTLSAKLNTVVTKLKTAATDSYTLSLGVLRIAINKTTVALKTFTAAMLTNPLTYFLLALVGTIVLLKRNWDTVWGGMKSVIDSFTGFFTKAISTVEEKAGFLTPIFNAIGKAVDGVQKAFQWLSERVKADTDLLLGIGVVVSLLVGGFLLLSSSVTANTLAVNSNIVANTRSSIATRAGIAVTNLKTIATTLSTTATKALTFSTYTSVAASLKKIAVSKAETVAIWSMILADKASAKAVRVSTLVKNISVLASV